MREKNKKEKKTETCIDCNGQTNDFYKIATNRGNIIKCAECYELWVLRGSRWDTYGKTVSGSMLFNDQHDGSESVHRKRGF